MTATYAGRVSVPTAGLSRDALHATSEQTLREVVPGNGDELAEVPAEVVMTFAADLPADASASVVAPGAVDNEPTVRVDGRDLVVGVPDAGPGLYEVRYNVDELTGSTGFTVLGPGQAPSPEPTTSVGVVLAVVMGVAVLAVIAMTVRRWRRR